MLASFLVFALVVVAPQAAPPQEIPVLKANLGDCSADFIVRGPDAQPLYNAIIHVRVRYGALSIKRSDLEIGTNSDGKARIEGLPNKARLLAYDVRKDDKKGAAEQQVADNCHAMFEVSLK